MRPQGMRRDGEDIQDNQSHNRKTNQNFLFHTYCFKRLTRSKNMVRQKWPNPLSFPTNHPTGLRDPKAPGCHHPTGYTANNRRNRAYNGKRLSFQYNTHYTRAYSCNRQKFGSSEQDGHRSSSSVPGQKRRTPRRSAGAAAPHRHQSGFLFSYVLFLKG